MRFTYAEAMTDPAFYLPLAQAAEAAGYTSMTVRHVMGPDTEPLAAKIAHLERFATNVIAKTNP